VKGATMKVLFISDVECREMWQNLNLIADEDKHKSACAWVRKRLSQAGFSHYIPVQRKHVEGGTMFWQ